MYRPRERRDFRDFDPEESYSKDDLELFADALLREDREASGDDHQILFEGQLAARLRREVYTNFGTPDPSIRAGVFSRPHVDRKRS